MGRGIELEPTFFTSPSELHTWLAEHHDTATELWLGFYKKGATETGITYAEALDEALCFGWIDGVRKRLDDARFMIRFTPRKPHSIWSAVNIARASQLSAQGVMRPAGLAAFEGRDRAKERQYTYEREERPLDGAYERQFRANAKAWDFFQAQPPSYRRLAIGWVAGAKREETRQKRLATLIADSEQGRRLAHYTRPPKA
jgi:uncharacterized protein YdeI (YjbR/CyaY-like superfamily)